MFSSANCRNINIFLLLFVPSFTFYNRMKKFRRYGKVLFVLINLYSDVK